MNRITRCKGLRTSTFVYRSPALKLALQLIEGMRPQFISDCRKPELWQGEMLAGHWVHDDGHVLCMLVSSATEDEFLSEPLTWITDAFQACAEHDWLALEKLSDEREANRRSEEQFDRADQAFDCRLDRI